MRATLAAAVLALGASVARAEDPSDALAAGRFGEALRLADEGLESRRGDARLWTLRGIALEGLERLPDSLTSFQRALALEPQSLAALKGAAEVAYRMRSPEAARLVRRVLAREPGSETAHAMAGAMAVEANQCATAVEHFAKSGAALQRSPPALAQYAGCLLRLERPREAGQVLERIVEASPGDAAARYNLAVCRLKAGETAEALAAARTAMAMAPDDPEALNLFAAASAAAGEIQPAVAALRKAIQMAPADERHYLDLAALCLEHDALNLAMEVVEAGLGNVVASAKLHTLRGAIHAERSELDQAMRDFEQASLLGPDELYGSVGMSLVLRQADRTPEAIALLREKLGRHPGDATLHYLLGDALMRSGPSPASPEFAEARAALGRALDARPDFAKARAALGKLLLRAGDAPAAAAELRLAVELDPANRLALNQLVMAYRQLGREEDARAVAGRLRALLEKERIEEFQRNRVRLVRGAPGEGRP